MDKCASSRLISPVPRLRLDLLVAHDAPMDPDALRDEAARQLGVQTERVEAVKLHKRALDARRRLEVPTWRLTVDADVRGPVDRARARGRFEPTPPEAPRLVSPRVHAPSARCVVVGAGPAGLFAAWHLAEMGAKVTLVERGKPVETRARDFGLFRGRGVLNPESNLCFGEGGAGTYSDGKLYTRKNDVLVREVYERFVATGAPPSILVDAKPHIGTNKLFRMLQRIRAELLSHGVELLFERRVERLCVESGRVTGVALHTGHVVPADHVVLAVGHSAHDTFRALLAQGVPMEPKPFAVGVRIEHPQSLIDDAQYRCGRERPSTLPPADYRLTDTKDGVGVYSFCMCPGGMIVPTATVPNTVVVNGMSTARRSSRFANSGLVVSVSLDELARQGFGRGPLAGVEFQHRLESLAFQHGGGTYFAPAVRADHFLAKKTSPELADTHFRPGLTPADLRDVLPAFVTQGLERGLRRFAGQIKGYAGASANLIAVESRTSSPIRIPRDERTMEVPGFAGLAVAGEGPGYAGGIVSAAVDGLKVAQAILQRVAADRAARP